MIGIAPFTPQAFHTVGSGLFASFRSVAYPRWSLHEPLKPSAGCQRWTVAKRGSWCVANPDLLREDGQKDHALSRVAQVTRSMVIYYPVQVAEFELTCMLEKFPSSN